jgi:hypothetical protein
VVDTNERILYTHPEMRFLAAQAGIDQASERAKLAFAKLTL